MAAEECSSMERAYSAQDFIKMIEWLLANAYSMFGTNIYRQATGIPTGTNVAPELTQLYLLYYEFSFMMRQLPNFRSLPEDLKILILTYQRYIDDIFRLRLISSPSEAYLYDRRDEGGSDGMYPVHLIDYDGTVLEMPLRLTSESGRQVPFLDVLITLDGGNLVWGLYNKRQFMFVGGIPLSDMRNFPHIDTKLTDMVKYGVVTSNMYRFAYVNKLASNFIVEVVQMIKKMIRAGYNKAKLIDKICHFRGWNKNLGKWHVILPRILKRLSCRTELVEGEPLMAP